MEKSLALLADKKPKSIKRRAALLVSLFFALCLAGYGGYGLWDWWQKTHTPEVSEDSDLEEPSETPISVEDNPPFEYEPDQPKIIELPSLAVSGYIQKVGLRKDNSVGIPSNISLAGWYTKSVAPGEKGLSIIDGHVRGNYNAGIFESLNLLKAGDAIKITYGDDSSREFEVVNVNSYPVRRASLELFNQSPEIENQLNLITCAGSFNEDQNTYSERVLVVTKPKS